MSSPLAKQATAMAANYKELEKYVKHVFFKAAQIIVQSRQGSKSFTESQPNPQTQSWFSLAINDNSEISHEAKKVTNASQLSGTGILSVPLCIEISLKTTEGDSLVLETWVLSMRDGSDPTIRPNTVYNHMGLLLKSLLCVTRVLPAYRLARKQGPDTHVMCYRIYGGEPSTSQLGSGQQSAQVGQVVTGCGTLQVRVDYRTSMTITPGNVATASDPSTFSSASSHSQAIWAKSDYFGDHVDNLDRPPSDRHTPRKTAAANNNSETSEQNMTSDESVEAMRIFAASPPDTFMFNKRTSDHYSSNESLGLNRFRPRSNTNQSQKSEDGQDSNTEIKVGAFATKKTSTDKPRTGCGNTDDDNSLLELFSVDPEPEEKQQRDEEEVALTRAKLQKMNLDKSPAQRKLLFDEEEEKTQVLHNKGQHDFVMLDFKAPFSAKPAEDCKGDLGIFFKDVQAAPQLRSTSFVPLTRRDTDDSPVLECDSMTSLTLESQLQNLDDQLHSFESNLHEYDNLLKTLEFVATTSESESEAN